MKATGTCPKCEYKEVIPAVRVLDRGDSNIVDDLCVATYKHPEALIFKGEQRSKVFAWVCARCGFVEFYVDDLDTLKSAGF